MFLSIFVHCTYHSLSEGSKSLAFVQKRRAGDNGFDKRGHLVPARRQLRPHLLKQRLIRKHQRTAERVDKRLFAQAVQKILLATGANITLQAVESGALTPARERRLDIHLTPG